jgi:hypothetical protein
LNPRTLGPIASMITTTPPRATVNDNKLSIRDMRFWWRWWFWLRASVLKCCNSSWKRRQYVPSKRCYLQVHRALESIRPTSLTMYSTGMFRRFLSFSNIFNDINIIMFAQWLNNAIMSIWELNSVGIPTFRRLCPSLNQQDHPA